MTAMDANFKSCLSFDVSQIFDDLLLDNHFLDGTDPTMQMCEHLVEQGKITRTSDAWTFFPTQPVVELGTYDDVWRYIFHNPGEWGCPYDDIMNFLECKFCKYC